MNSDLIRQGQDQHAKMANDKLRLFLKFLPLIIPYSFQLLRERIAGLIHAWTYRATPDPVNVVIVGGSFAGITLAKRLVTILPTGYRVILIEKNSHFNYSFNFPRYSVLQGSEHAAFIPYHGIASGAPPGIFEHVHDRAIDITDTQVLLASGKPLDYKYLVIATGSSSPLPAKVEATDKDAACAELRSVQERIKDAQKIAVIGAGAVGVELATDIKAFYPDKDVTIVHSRDRLLNKFGKKLHDYVFGVLEEMGIDVVLGARPRLELNGGIGAQTMELKDGVTEKFDLVVCPSSASTLNITLTLTQIPCTGQRPNSSIVASYRPDAISEGTGLIKVCPTLQVITAGKSSSQLFACGDVAEHGGPLMARASHYQSQVVANNILSLIKGRNTRLKNYVPQHEIEGSLKLTLGKTRYVMFMADGKEDILVVRDDGGLHLEVQRAWWYYGAKDELKLSEVS